MTGCSRRLPAPVFHWGLRSCQWPPDQTPCAWRLPQKCRRGRRSYPLWGRSPCRRPKRPLAILIRRRHHHDLPHPCDSGGDHVHQNGGGEGLRRSGDTDAHPFDGGVPLAHDDAGVVGEGEVTVYLLFMEMTDVFRRHVQRSDELRIQRIPRRIQLCLRYLQLL